MVQTPNSPIAAGNSGGRKTGMRIILVCHGISQNDPEVCSKLPGSQKLFSYPLVMKFVAQGNSIGSILDHIIKMKPNLAIDSMRQF